MKTKLSVLFMALAIAVCSVGCQSQEKRTRKVTVEGPEKKTEVKIETTEKK